MDISSISTRESLGAVRPATPPPKQSSLKIFYGFLSCRLLGNLSSSTLDMPRKRYLGGQTQYDQYMDDLEKHEREEQEASSSVPSTATRCTRFSFETQKFPERLREVVEDIWDIRKRLHGHRYVVKPGRPNWDKQWPKTTCKAQQKKKNDSNESLSVYKPGQMSRRERYEARLRDPTSKEARRKAACEEQRRSSMATIHTSSGRSNEVDTEMEMFYQRVRDIDRRNKVLVGSLGVKPSRARKEQPEELWEGMGSGPRSLGTAALKGTD